MIPHKATPIMGFSWKWPRLSPAEEWNPVRPVTLLLRLKDASRSQLSLLAIKASRNTQHSEINTQQVGNRRNWPQKKLSQNSWPSRNLSSRALLSSSQRGRAQNPSVHALIWPSRRAPRARFLEQYKRTSLSLPEERNKSNERKQNNYKVKINIHRQN